MGSSGWSSFLRNTPTYKMKKNKRNKKKKNPKAKRKKKSKKSKRKVKKKKRENCSSQKKTLLRLSTSAEKRKTERKEKK